MAEQLTATNGPCLRRLALWMPWATSSLPVPLSPRMSTGRSTSAQLLASETAACMMGFTAMTSPKWCLAMNPLR